MMKNRLLALGFMLAAVVQMTATVHNVSVGNFFFTPSSLTITAGDTVRWTNTTGTHNVDGSNASNPVTFGNGPAASGAWTYQFQFNTVGTYNYVCTPHAGSMQGTITVNAASTTVAGAVSQSFETTAASWPFTFNPATYNTSGDIWDTVSSLSSISPSAGANFWGMQDLDNPNGGGAFGHTLTFATVDVSSLTNPVVKFDYYTIGFDATDSLAYQVEFNNGTGFTSKVQLNSNSLAWVTETITIPQGTQFVRLRIYAVQNGGSDYAGVDNFRVESAATTPGIPTYPIADISTVDANGVADSLNVECKLVGFVSTPNYRSSGVEFTFTDANNSSGIVVRNTSFSGYTPTMGDELRVIGTIGQFRGLIQLDVDSIVVLSSGNTLPVPAVFTSLGENTEGRIIRLNGMRHISGTWGVNNNLVYFPNGGDTVTLRFDTDFTTNFGTQPTGAFDVIGVGGQFNSSTSAPFDNGYQIFPRGASDIITSTGGVPNYGGIITYDIDSINGVDANGVLDSVGVMVRLVGIVKTPNFRSSGVEFTLTNKTNTAGVVVRNTSFNGYTPTVGDEVRVMGTLAQFRGLAQLNLDSIVVMTTNNSLVPTIETSLGEQTESRFIRLNGMRHISGTWGVNNNLVYFPNGGDTVTLRFDTDFTNNFGTQPTGAFDIIGVGGQFGNSTAPFLDGYQVFPRDSSDIIAVVAANPTINFPVSAQTQAESAGTVTISLPIAPVSTSAETVKIAISNGAGITAGDYSTTPAAVNDTITLTAAASATAVSFDVVINDDATQEADEDITFTLVSQGGLSIGTVGTHVFTIEDNDTPIPTYDISQIDGVDANGVMDSAGVYCKIIATVTSPQLSATRTDFFITNATNTAGIKINQSGLIPYSAVVGDEIRVVGTLSQFRGGIQISADSLTVLSSGNPIQPTVFGGNLGENTEGRVLRLNGVELVDTTGWPSANFGNFDIVLSTGDTVILRLDSDIPTLWGPAPAGTFDVIGVCGQYASSSSAPFLDGYQIQPRVSTEIIVQLPKLAITEIMPSSNLSNTAINGDWFEITNYGTSSIDLNGFSWDDDSRTSGAHTFNSSLVLNGGASLIVYDGVGNEDSAWVYEWRQVNNNVTVITADDFNNIGFSGLSSSGDEVNLFDDKGQLVFRAAYTSANISAGISVEFDTTASLIGASVPGVRGAYVSLNGEIGSPANRMPVSLNEFMLKNISLYPNPTSGMVKLSSDNNALKQVEIIDMNGRVVRSFSSSQRVVEIDLTALAEGVYMVQIESEGARATRKLIVQ